MPDPIILFTNQTPQNISVPSSRNPGVVQLLDWSGSIINSANPLPINFGGSLPAGTNIIGATGTFGRIDATPTVQNAQYVLGNSLGGLISLALPRISSGILQSVSIQSIGGATTGINAFLFDANPSGSTFIDKSTFTIAAADEAKRINKSAYALTPAATTGDAVTGAEVTNLARVFSSAGTIYLALCSTGTFTPATTTDIRVAIGFVLNP